MPRLRLALARTDPVVGDIAGNAGQVVGAARSAVASGADLLATGQMTRSGYPIEDLAAQPNFLGASSAAVSRLPETLQAEGLGELVVIVGHPDGPRLLGTSNAPTAIAQNCASVLHRGRVVARYAKHHLTNYSVSEWKRRQGAIGPKISGMALGRDRRLPITYRPTR